MRELRNVIEQAVLMSSGDPIGPEDLMLPAGAPSARPDVDTPDAAPGSTLDRMERDLLVKALQEAQFNVSQAARILGISRDTLRYRMDKHGLKN